MVGLKRIIIALAALVGVAGICRIGYGQEIPGIVLIYSLIISVCVGSALGNSRDEGLFADFITIHAITSIACIISTMLAKTLFVQEIGIAFTVTAWSVIFIWTVLLMTFSKEFKDITQADSEVFKKYISDKKIVSDAFVQVGVVGGGLSTVILRRCEAGMPESPEVAKYYELVLGCVLVNVVITLIVYVVCRKIFKALEKEYNKRVCLEQSAALDELESVLDGQENLNDEGNADVNGDINE